MINKYQGKSLEFASGLFDLFGLNGFVEKQGEKDNKLQKLSVNQVKYR